jgi:hypothetical protein
MVFFEWVVVILGGAVVLAGLARRLGPPYPAIACHKVPEWQCRGAVPQLGD